MPRPHASVPPDAIRIEDEVWQEAFTRREPARPRARLHAIEGGRTTAAPVRPPAEVLSTELLSAEPPPAAALPAEALPAEALPVAPAPEAHLDACHLPWEKKKELGAARTKRVAA